MSNFGRSSNRGKQRSHDRGLKFGSRGKEALEKIEDNSEVIQSFKKYAKELDKRHDKYERLVKLSRDITIESKRIIFLLHTIDRDCKKTSVIIEAEQRLEVLVSQHWQAVAKELQNEDPYLYHRAFSPGMQEFMEAFLFCNCLKDEKFPHWYIYQNKLKYLNQGDVSNETDNQLYGTSVLLVPVDYVLGLADVTGELMRKCINNLGEGDVQGCYKTCNFVRTIYSGFLTITVFGNKEMSQKAYTLRQSLLKMEMVCYNIHVRGSEIPKYMLADVDVQRTYEEEDEGFFG